MADRSLKNVEDVEVGDRLLGYDNQPRTVLKLCRGQDTMYRVKSRDNLWNDFIVNKEHVLPLFDIANPNKLFEIEVDQYLKLDQKRKNHLKIISGTKYNQSYSCFDIEQLGQDDYYGFQLDGDHLYYNEDYVLQHNSGKSLIIYLILRWMLSKDRKCVIIVPSTSLVEQMVDDFKKYSVNDDSWDAEREVAKLYSKVQTDPFEVDALVTTWQSIVKYDASLYKTWDCVLVDECFDGDTKVLTPDGYVPISSLKVGDIVTSYNEEKHVFEQDTVVKLQKNLTNSSSEKMYELTFDNGVMVKVTGNHQFLTNNRGWVRADQLTEDDDLVELRNTIP